MQFTFSIFQMEPLNMEGGHVLPDYAGTSGKAQQDIGRRIVAEPDSQLQEAVQGNVNIRCWIFVLQWAVGFRQDQVLLTKPYWLVQGEFSFFNLMKNFPR